MAWHPFRNVGLKVAALGLGTLVWFTVSGPRVERTISGVPVIYRNVPASLEISDQTEEASVHVRGTDSQIRRLEPGDLVVEIDLAGERPGLLVLPLRTDQVTVPFGIDVTEVSPGAVTLTLEESASVEVPVRPTIDGKPAAGFVEAGTKVDPAMVTVVGPARRLKTMTAAITAAGVDRRCARHGDADGDGRCHRSGPAVERAANGARHGADRTGRRPDERSRADHLPRAREGAPRGVDSGNGECVGALSVGGARENAVISLGAVRGCDGAQGRRLHAARPSRQSRHVHGGRHSGDSGRAHSMTTSGFVSVLVLKKRNPRSLDPHV